MHRPKHKTSRDASGAAQKRAEPTASRATVAIIYVREIRSDRYPAARENTAPVINIEDTTRPCSAGDIVLGTICYLVVRIAADIHAGSWNRILLTQSDYGIVASVYRAD